MRNTLLFAATMMVATNILAQEDTVLQHIAPENATATHNYWGQTFQGSAGWGYYIGHNLWGDEAFAEKYEIEGTGKVLGVIAHFAGKTASLDNIRYKVYTVGSNGLPAQTIGQRQFTLQSVPTDGSAHSIMFTNPVNVSERFFVALDLGDYSHDPLAGDTLCLLSGEDGSRPSSDDTFGRNAIRWHSHGAENWKDFFTQNFTPVSTYFAIYPIMEGTVASVPGIFADDRPPVIYPMPAVNDLNIGMNLREARDINVRIIGMDGRELMTRVFPMGSGEGTLRLDISHLATGSYVLAMESGALRHAQVILKN